MYHTLIHGRIPIFAFGEHDRRYWSGVFNRININYDFPPNCLYLMVWLGLVTHLIKRLSGQLLQLLPSGRLSIEDEATCHWHLTIKYTAASHCSISRLMFKPKK